MHMCIYMHAYIYIYMHIYINIYMYFASTPARPPPKHKFQMFMFLEFSGEL